MHLVFCMCMSNIKQEINLTWPYPNNMWWNKRMHYTIVSDHLSHTKDAVYTFMKTLFIKLFIYKGEVSPSYANINTFSNGALTQFK